MKHKWKKILISTLDVVLVAYLVLAVTSFNTPMQAGRVCSKVDISIDDSCTEGFLSANEIKRLLQASHRYPLGDSLLKVSPRGIEDLLKGSPFVKTAECYKTIGGHVCIKVSQLRPVVRIKAQNGDDYYLDDRGGIMPNSKYTSDLIIATGAISRPFARRYLCPLAKAIMSKDIWNNQIEQINVLPGGGIELVPRVGNQIVYVGNLPAARTAVERDEAINNFVNTKLTRLDKFYKYGLSQAGWNKYSYIDLEFDNQIICKKRETTKQEI